MNKTDKNRLNKYLSGEFIFTCVLFIIALICLFMSIKLWNEMEAPRLASAAAIPLIVSAIWSALSLYLIFRYIIKGEANETEKVFSRKLITTFVAIVIYCLAIYLGINFYLLSGAFLFGLISYLGKNHIAEHKSVTIYYVKNVAVSVTTMLAIFLLFEVLFGIKF